jgi:hypothetical protein
MERGVVRFSRHVLVRVDHIPIERERERERERGAVQKKIGFFFKKKYQPKQAMMLQVPMKMEGAVQKKIGFFF